MTTLPQADWTRREDLAALVSALGEGAVRWVGGCVRDTLLGDQPADVDAATTWRPDQVISRLDAAGIRSVPTGIDHGTVTAILPGGHVEITTLRKDVATDGRRATIAYADDWQDDAARRDFTINALYCDPQTLDVFDWFGGLRDLDQRRVRFIGDARQRIREDHLRILRYYRFHARFGGAVDEEAEQACRELAATLKGLSRERVAMEVSAILSLPDPAEAIRRMNRDGVLAVILPEVGEEGMVALDKLLAAERRFRAPPASLRRLAALLPAEPRVTDKVAARLKLSRAQKKYLACCAARSPSDATAPRALAYRSGTECARDRLLLASADPAALQDWSVPVLPLKGGEIVQRGVAAGPDVARILQAVETRWVEEGFPGRDRVEELLGEELDRG